MNLPEKLYKYESFSIQSLLNLKNQQIYFGSPSAFNDPYDCALKVNIQDVSEEELKELKERYFSQRIPLKVRELFESATSQEQKNILLRAARSACEEAIDRYHQSVGVSCFSEINDELLMWAHYADKYKGFCLEFDTNNDLFNKTNEVNYVDEMPKISVRNIVDRNQPSDLINLLCTKSKAWSYEKEWRCIHEEAGKLYGYSAETLTGVYFGPNMDQDACAIICLVLKGQNPNVRFWQGTRSEAKFKVEFKEFI